MHSLTSAAGQGSNSSAATTVAVLRFAVPVARVQRRTEGEAVSTQCLQGEITPTPSTDAQLGEGNSRHDVTTLSFQRLQMVTNGQYGAKDRRDDGTPGTVLLHGTGCTGSLT